MLSKLLLFAKLSRKTTRTPVTYFHTATHRPLVRRFSPDGPLLRQVIALPGVQPPGYICATSGVGCSLKQRGTASVSFSSLATSGGAQLAGNADLATALSARSEVSESSDDKAAEVKRGRGPLEVYRELVREGRLKAGDERQADAAVKLQEVHDRLLSDNDESSRHSWKRYLQPLRRFAMGSATRNQTRRGLYLFGGVGTGKTMLLDFFYQGVPLERKLRVHFHEFMLETHARLHALERSYAVKLRQKDPIAMVADQLSDNVELICLDEVEVTDIADALILLRLFTILWERGVVLVATSNSVPEKLYRNGLNRQLFEPFIPLLHQHCDVLCLDAGTDYRRGHDRLPLFITSKEGEDTWEAMDQAFAAVADCKSPSDAHSEEVAVMMGRTLDVPQAAGPVARFSFDEICGKPLGAADYLALASKYSAVFIDRVPWLGDPAVENAARRMVTLIDILYEHHGLLVCSAAVPLDALFAAEAEETNAYFGTAESGKTKQQQQQQQQQQAQDGNDRPAESTNAKTLSQQQQQQEEEEHKVQNGVEARQANGHHQQQQQQQQQHYEHEQQEAQMNQQQQQQRQREHIHQDQQPDQQQLRDHTKEGGPGEEESQQHPQQLVQFRVLGEGGASGRSTTMIGSMEWSGTGRLGASLADVADHRSFTRVASQRTLSRLLEMQSRKYIEAQPAVGKRAAEFFSRH
eukprot:TRINITY_DN668_c0_g6_i1.p1 TRINITY_DN668_c0_g6~~TRINITY_DN668_c0_g6_i1.p1  ORF type:complete len:693 (+),score=167.80 TRINITY_DN668_c0_g6_i1:578-2656(+)